MDLSDSRRAGSHPLAARRFTRLVRGSRGYPRSGSGSRVARCWILLAALLCCGCSSANFVLLRGSPLNPLAQQSLAWRPEKGPSLARRHRAISPPLRFGVRHEGRPAWSCSPACSRCSTGSRRTTGYYACGRVSVVHRRPQAAGRQARRRRPAALRRDGGPRLPISARPAALPKVATRLTLSSAKAATFTTRRSRPCSASSAAKAACSPAPRTALNRAARLGTSA